MNAQDVELDSTVFDRFGNEVEVIAVDEPFVWVRRIDPARKSDEDARGFVVDAKRLYTERMQ